MTERKNFTGQVPPSIIDDEYRNCNFSQPAPIDDAGDKRGVVIFQADTTPRTFIECNLVNCEVPPGSTVTGCNTTIKTFNVETTLDTFTVDSNSEPKQHHSNFVYGRWTPGGYVDLPTPEEHEVD